MPYFIQRRDNDRLETVDQFTDSKEAFATAREYNLSDSFAHYYVTRQPCRAWNDED